MDKDTKRGLRNYIILLAGFIILAVLFQYINISILAGAMFVASSVPFVAILFTIKSECFKLAKKMNKEK